MSPKVGENQTRPKNVPKAKVKQDEAIIGTNDYSIVSKRSVEKLYYKDEPQFLRAFVHKFKRRAPLINRGYWLRMRAIEAVVKHFLDENTNKSKVIVNLGCGYEPLAFRMLWKHPSQCHNTRFVDVDFPQLIQKKIQIIQNDPLLYERLSKNTSTSESTPSASILFTSSQYDAVGCDLGDQSQLKDVFMHQLKLDDHAVLFIGEVSVVYMPHQEATEVIKFCASLPDARFCLLEQHLPAGFGHPFARTMQSHFNKQTPLRGLLTYHTMQSQIDRFHTSGWPNVETTDLWSLWQNDNFISDAERVALGKVEPFDEFEGFALFAGHYFLLLSTTEEAYRTSEPWMHDMIGASNPGCMPLVSPIKILFDSIELPENHGRTNGSIFQPDSSSLIHCGGTVNNPRQGVCDVYARKNYEPTDLAKPPVDLNCTTITVMADGSYLLVGGRTSPVRPSDKCYQFSNKEWRVVASLEPARYRHCAVSVTIDDKFGVLVVGGRGGSEKVLDDWCLFLDQKWHSLDVSGDRPPGIFGAVLVTTGTSEGVFTGGLTETGRFPSSTSSPGFWRWKLQSTSPGSVHVCVTFVKIRDDDNRTLKSLQRFVASTAETSDGVLLIGGIGPRGPLRLDEELVLLKTGGTVVPCEPVLSAGEELPMLIGHSTIHDPSDKVIMLGGGTVCFSFGAHWNTKLYQLIMADSHHSHAASWDLVTEPPKLSNEQCMSSTPQHDLKRDTSIISSLDNLATIKGTDVERINNNSEFHKHVYRHRAKPIVIEGLQFGTCINDWTVQNLKEKVGSDKPTVIHTAEGPHLSFQEKNFSYETVPFGQFIDAAKADSHVYLRALSTDKPSKVPSSLSVDYPALAKDFQIPDELNFAKEHQHSSVLRISGNITMWLHYDVMSNFLFQITGSKRILLFPPQDVSKLNFSAGETTSSLDVFSTDSSPFASCSPMEITLSAGEVLFIPACWPHATAPARTESGELSVAVNVFFKSLDDSFYAAGRDVYGNRDLAFYENGRKHVSRVVGLAHKSPKPSVKDAILALSEMLRSNNRVSDKAFGGKEVNRIIDSAKSVPHDIAHFYLSRLADELANAAQAL